MTLKAKLRRREAMAKKWRLQAFESYRLNAPIEVVRSNATRYARWAKLADLTCQRVLEAE